MHIANSWAAYQFDNAVVFLGITIENALQERVETGIGKHKEYREKYTIAQLLHEKFRLPRPESKMPVDPLQSFVAQLNAYAGQPGSNVKRWTYVGPQPEANGNKRT
jgi:hypothetical protein